VTIRPLLIYVFVLFIVLMLTALLVLLFAIPCSDTYRRDVVGRIPW
jgi:hypothetical protein